MDFNPLDIFTQAWQGNWVAWFAIALFICVVGAFSFVIILWWKLPQFAKKAFINNTVGGHRPTVAECYENRLVKFQIPQIFRSGLSYDKGAWYLYPKTWATSSEELTAGEREVLNAIYTIQGAPSAFYLNYSIQAQAINPELVAICQHEAELNKLRQDQPVKIKKELFIEALQLIKDDYIQLKPMFLHFPLDIKGIKTMLPKSLSKSELGEQENRIRQDVRANMGGFGSNILMKLGIVAIAVMDIVLLLKSFNVF